MSSAPPRLSITGNTRVVAISYGFSVADNVIRKDVFFSDVFTYPPNVGLPVQYREGRVLSMRIYWQSDNSTSDAGSVCLNVEDYGENSGTKTVNFDELISYPGSMVRKVWQNVSNRWFPTEPSDRNFSSLVSDIGICTITVRHSISDSKLKGRVLCLIRAQLRGKSDQRCKAVRQLLLQENLAAITEDMDLLEDSSQP